MGGGAGWPERAQALAARIEDALAALARWLDEPDELLEHRPEPGAWTAREIAEHVALTDRYLLILVEKIAARSRARLARGAAPPAEPSRVDHLQALASRATRWRHPEHMTPAGRVSKDELRAELLRQAARCRELLAEMPRGEGALHAIRMSAVGAGDERLDLYQFLEVVALHAERHLRQMERNREAFERR